MLGRVVWLHFPCSFCLLLLLLISLDRDSRFGVLCSTGLFYRSSHRIWSVHAKQKEKECERVVAGSGMLMRLAHKLYPPQLYPLRPPSMGSMKLMCLMHVCIPSIAMDLSTSTESCFIICRRSSRLMGDSCGEHCIAVQSMSRCGFEIGEVSFNTFMHSSEYRIAKQSSMSCYWLGGKWSTIQHLYVSFALDLVFPIYLI
jgi:hypothetical protein